MLLLAGARLASMGGAEVQVCHGGAQTSVRVARPAQEVGDSLCLPSPRQLLADEVLWRTALSAETSLDRGLVGDVVAHPVDIALLRRSRLEASAWGQGKH